MGKRRSDSRVPDMNPNAHTGDGEYSLNSRQNILLNGRTIQLNGLTWKRIKTTPNAIYKSVKCLESVFKAHLLCLLCISCVDIQISIVF